MHSELSLWRWEPPDRHVAWGHECKCGLTCCPVGFAGAVSTRVSNELGAGFPLAARIAALVASLLALGIMLGIAAAVAAGRWAIADLLASDLHVRAAVAAVLPVLALATIGDGLNAVLSGRMARGQGATLLEVFCSCLWAAALPELALITPGDGLNALLFSKLACMPICSRHMGRPGCLLSALHWPHLSPW